MSPVLQRLCWVLALPAVLGLLLGGGILYLGMTEHGTRLALAAATRASGGQLTCGTVEGTLGSRLTLGEVSFVAGETSFAARHLVLRWRPAALLRGRLHVLALHVREGRLHLPPGSDEPSSLNASYPALPVALRIDELLLEDSTLEQAATPRHLERLRAVLRVDRQALQITALEVDVEGQRISATARLDHRPHWPLTAHLTWRGEAGGHAGDAEATFSGPLDALALAGHFALGQRGKVHGRVNLLAPQPAVDLQIEVEPFVLDEAGSARVANLRVGIRGTPARLAAELSTTLAVADQPPRDLSITLPELQFSDTAISGKIAWQALAAAPDPLARLAGEGEFTFTGERLQVRHAFTAPLPLTTTGTLAKPWADPVLDLVSEWQVASLVLPDIGPLVIGPGRLQLAGPRSEITASGETAATLAATGPISARWRGTLHSSDFRLDELDLALLAGSLHLAGAVDWAQLPRGVFAFNGRDLDLAALRPDLATRLALRGEGTFAVGESGLATTLQLAEASGRWRDQTLTAHARLHTLGENVSIEEAKLSLGRNQATLHASLGEQLEAIFEVAFPDLGDFAADLAGTLHATGSARGMLTAPAVSASFTGRDLRFQSHAARSVEGTVALDLAQDAAAKIDLQATGARFGDAPAGTLSLRLAGTTLDHHLELAFSAPARRVRARVRGGWQDQQWNGTLQQLGLTLEELGDWSLVAPGALSVGAGELTLAPSCLAQKTARLCLGVPRWSPEDGEANLNVQAVPLALARNFLPPTVALAGEAGVQARVAQTGGVIRATGTANVVQGAISLTPAEGRQETIPLHKMHLAFELDQATARATAQVDAGEWFTLDTSARLALSGQRALSGRFDARSTKLAWIGEFLPELAGTRGGAQFTGTFGGTRTVPIVHLRGQLADGELRVAQTGTRISALDFTLDTLDAKRLAFALKAGEGGGTLALEGQWALAADSGWPGTLTISGRNFPLVRLPEAEADVSPDLKLDFSRQRLDVSGRLEIPRVAVHVAAMPESAVSVSADEVVVGGKQQTAAEPAERHDFLREAVAGNVELVLGEHIGITAAGLSAQLAGSLRWTKARGEGLGRGEGRITIPKGGYKAYGQDLVIESGQLVFGGAIDNPGLEVRAIRPDLAVIPGIRITGSLTAPEFLLFSRPALPDSEVLSYLITGHPLDEASAGEAGLIAQAALSLGAERGSVITSQLQQAFGLDEFSVNTGTTAAETSFALGKRLSPKLAVRSDFNPFDQLSSVFINYQLTDTWSVEAESGQRQGANLLYSFERDSVLPEGWGD